MSNVFEHKTITDAIKEIEPNSQIAIAEVDERSDGCYFSDVVYEGFNSSFSKQALLNKYGCYKLVAPPFVCDGVINILCCKKTYLQHVAWTKFIRERSFMKCECGNCLLGKECCVDSLQVYCALDNPKELLDKDHKCHWGSKNFIPKDNKNKSLKRLSANSLILPIKPHFAKAIYNGEKHFELRKRLPAVSIDTIVLYETAPVSKITGAVSVYSDFEGNISQDKKNKDFFRDLCTGACISEADFIKYFAGSQNYYGWILNTDCKYIFNFPQPVDILKLKQIQSYSKLKDFQIGLLNYMIDKGY